MSQDVPTVEGQHYTVDFWLSNYGFGTTNTEFDASWNGATLVSLANPYLPDYTEYQFDVVGAAGSSHLEFAVRSDMMLGLDDVTVSPYTTQEVVPTTQSTAGILAFSDVDLSDSHGIAMQPQAADYLGSFDAQLAQDSTCTRVRLDRLGFLGREQMPSEYLSEGRDADPELRRDHRRRPRGRQRDPDRGGEYRRQQRRAGQSPMLMIAAR